MKFTDAVAVSKVRQTTDGYLVAEARAAREGIQNYTGAEVGVTDKAVVRVYRPRDEVFAQESLQSFSHAPITMDHPSEGVTAENWKDLAVGEVSTAAMPDGQWVTLPLILKDAKAIAAVRLGKCELSAGYTCELDFTPGVTADGQAYDAQQRSIRVNHLAIVDRARAGSEARIGDAVKWGAAPITMSSDKEVVMTDALKTVVLGDKAAQVAVADAPIIEQFKADMAKKLSDAETAHAAAISAKDGELAKKDAEIDDLKGKQLDAAALDAKVQARADLIAKAKAVAPGIVTDGKGEADIRRAAVAAKKGEAAIADKSPAYIEAAFDLLADTDTVRDAFRSGEAKPIGDAKAQADAAYAKRTAAMGRAWEGTPAA